jgi:hypothetical protein
MRVAVVFKGIDKAMWCREAASRASRSSAASDRIAYLMHLMATFRHSLLSPSLIDPSESAFAQQGAQFVLRWHGAARALPSCAESDVIAMFAADVESKAIGASFATQLLPTVEFFFLVRQH